MDPDVGRIVNAFLMDVIRSETHRQVLDGDRAPPRLQARLLKMAGMDPTEKEDAITIRIEDRDWRFGGSNEPKGPEYRMRRHVEVWQIHVTFLLLGQVELVAERMAEI